MFKKHCKNLKEIERSISILERAINETIRKKRKDEEKIYTKLLCAIIVSWLEIRLLKLLYEVSDYKNLNSAKIFSSTEILNILNKNFLLDKWIVALNIAAQKAYSLKLSHSKLKITNFKKEKTFELRYKELVQIINNELPPIINLRNKVDHGQLLYAYNSLLTDLSQDATTLLRTINIVNLRQRKNIFKSVACIIHDLTVSKATFERDFDLHMTNIQNAIQNAKDIDYEKYKCRITK